MTAADWIMIIAAIGGILLSMVTAVTTAAITVVTIIIQRRVSDARKGIAEVHTLVNDRSTKQDERIDQLSRTIERTGAVVPDRPS